MLTSLEPWMSHEGSTARWGSTAIARDTAVDPQSTAVLQIAAGTADVFHGNSGCPAANLAGVGRIKLSFTWLRKRANLTYVLCVSESWTYDQTPREKPAFMTSQRYGRC